MTCLTTFLCFSFMLFLTATFTGGREFSGADYLQLKSEVSRFFRPVSDDGDSLEGKRWAVLIAGSKGFENYRHQADVCHAYQLLKRGGLKDENIVVFMYDDIANNPGNPRKGKIINNPNAEDVYKGVPKDYTGNNVNVNNFFAVILGNRTALKGGSGKVVKSGPNDHIFIYYSDHGSPGVLGMPTSPNLYAKDLNDVLKKKHDSKGYKSLVFYLEACESGSIFEGLLPKNLNIYATTAANAVESSWATYCPGDKLGPPPEYTTCVGDLYSVAWIEDSYQHDLRNETLKQQYERVKKRTLNHGSPYGSHVMMYGDKKLGNDKLYLYMGASSHLKDESSLRLPSRPINQRDADLVHFWAKYRNEPEGSARKAEARKKLLEAMSHRMHIDDSVNLIGKLLFGLDKGPEVLGAVRSGGKPLVDDWDCLKSLVRTFEEHCGSLSHYGMKHMRSFANICNAGVRAQQTAAAAVEACPTFPSNPWGSLRGGFSA